MANELVTVQELPVNGKEIQIPSKELTTVQKAQYRKDIEAMRDDLVRKIDACIKAQKEKFLSANFEKFHQKIADSKAGKILVEINKLRDEWNNLIDSEFMPLTVRAEHLEKSLKSSLKHLDNTKTPDISFGALTKTEQLEPSHCVDGWDLKSALESDFEVKFGKRFDLQKKKVQLQYKQLVTALSFYKVDHFKRVLMQFLRTSDKINAAYVALINQEVVEVGTE